jgi:hypothetical protein
LKSDIQAPLFASSDLENFGVVETTNDLRQVAVVAVRDSKNSSAFSTIRVPGGSRAALVTEKDALELWLLPSEASFRVEIRALATPEKLPWEGCT